MRKEITSNILGTSNFRSSLSPQPVRAHPSDTIPARVARSVVKQQQQHHPVAQFFHLDEQLLAHILLGPPFERHRLFRAPASCSSSFLASSATRRAPLSPATGATTRITGRPLHWRTFLCIYVYSRSRETHMKFACLRVSSPLRKVLSSSTRSRRWREECIGLFDIIGYIYSLADSKEDFPRARMTCTWNFAISLEPSDSLMQSARGIFPRDPVRVLNRTLQKAFQMSTFLVRTFRREWCMLSACISYFLMKALLIFHVLSSYWTNMNFAFTYISEILDIVLARLQRISSFEL